LALPFIHGILERETFQTLTSTPSKSSASAWLLWTVGRHCKTPLFSCQIWRLREGCEARKFGFAARLWLSLLATAAN